MKNIWIKNIMLLQIFPIISRFAPTFTSATTDHINGIIIIVARSSTGLVDDNDVRADVECVQWYSTDIINRYRNWVGWVDHPAVDQGVTVRVCGHRLCMSYLPLASWTNKTHQKHSNFSSMLLLLRCSCFSCCCCCCCCCCWWQR